MRRPRFDEHGLAPAVLLVAFGIALASLPPSSPLRRFGHWTADQFDVRVLCAFPNLTHLEDS